KILTNENSLNSYLIETLWRKLPKDLAGLGAFRLLAQSHSPLCSIAQKPKIAPIQRPQGLSNL
ncbi:MAG: hypothetical protein K2K25_07145, partial [Muribaculaceae bacterium]|nr:hypothetical protein [Muribaculaceae bacterium]